MVEQQKNSNEEEIEAKEEVFDEGIEDEMLVVKAKTPNQIKADNKKEFSENYQKYYPSQVLVDRGYKRTQCPKCKVFYWYHESSKNENCGDSNCVNKYNKIGEHLGIRVGREKDFTIGECWRMWEDHFTTTKPLKCTSIEKYPVVARWRNDVDFVGAGIYCYQPYCVTGELEPPANPLTQPQFCVRFNDLDNIGLTGRHYSGFVMMGIQAFNNVKTMKKEDIYFDSEVVQYNLEFLLDKLKIEPKEITFIEDIWAGGGNMGPCMEYFIGGLEVGNMVFTKYKYYPAGELEELDLKVIDVGTGLERVMWMLNGNATSYVSTFKYSLEYLTNILGEEIQYDQDLWNKLGPYTCRLNIDETDDIEKIWQDISDTIQVDKEVCKQRILPFKQAICILDHMRTLIVTIYDGALPSNVGGGNNLRNILRRTFSILKINNWWGKIGEFDGLIKLFNQVKLDLEDLYGTLPEYKSFSSIIFKEYSSYEKTETQNRDKIQKLVKQKKGKIEINDWITAITSWGISAEQIQNITRIQPPGDLYQQLEEIKLKSVKMAAPLMFQTADILETKNLYYQDHKNYAFQAKIVKIFVNPGHKDKKQKGLKNIVVLNQSAFYPTSGGQEHDTGVLTIDGQNYEVNNVDKVGKAVMHYLATDLPQDVEHYDNMEIEGLVDEERRNILRNHHTATHIVFASCRRVLGPHIWQNGAKKTTKVAHLDITHFSSLTNEQVMEIEETANSIVLQGKSIKKGLVPKQVAELEHGFKLYQGGIVPGNELRVVNIEDTDVEACCGIHCDNTNEVGWIKIIQTAHIQDGIVRLYYVAGTKCIERLSQQNKQLNSLMALFRTNQSALVNSAKKAFNSNIKHEKMVSEYQKSIVDLQMQLILQSPDKKLIIKSKEPNATIFFNNYGKYLKKIKEGNIGICIVAQNFVFCQLSQKEFIDSQKFLTVLNDKQDAKYTKNSSGKDGMTQLYFVGDINTKNIINYLKEIEFKESTI